MTSPGAAGPTGGDPLELLRYKLQVLRRSAGEPSLREISKRTGKEISHTTVSVVLHCAKPPPWGHVELVVSALQGNVDEFKQLWITVRNAHQPIPPPVEATVALTETLDADPAGVTAPVSGQRLSREPCQAEKLVALCGELQQVLELVGGMLVEHPGIDMPWMDELTRSLEASRFSVFGAGAAVLATPEGARQPGRPAVAAALGQPWSGHLNQSRRSRGGHGRERGARALQVLYRAHLIDYDYDADRWRTKQLIRDYVDELAARDLKADCQEAAFVRLLRHYQEHATDLARQAGCFLLRHSRPGPEPGPPPTWAGRMEALRYFETEHLNLLGCLHHAAERFHDAAEADLGAPLVALTDAMAGYLRNNGPWDIAEQAHRTAADIAERLGNPLAQAIALNDLGITHHLLGGHGEANQALQYAQRIFRGRSDTRTSMLGQANALNEMGRVANDMGRNTGDRRYHEDAKNFLTQAWDLYYHPDVLDIIGMANSAKNLGVALYRLGESSEAATWLERAQASYSIMGDILGLVEVHNHLGLLHLETDPKQAITEFHKAMRLMGDPTISSLLEEARAHEGIGLCQERNGEFADAGPSFEKAMDIYSRIGADQARNRVARRLDKRRGHVDP